MADYPLVRFVSAPSLGATTRFDLNPSSDIYTWHDGFTLGAPKFLGPPDAIAPELGLRQAKLTFQIKAPRAQLDTMMTDLARELMRPRNWLLVQRSADAKPRWLHTYASAPDDLSWAAVRNATNQPVPDTWTINLTIDADPDIWGAQESFSVTVTNNPASGGLFAALPTIKGDLPAPLVATVTPSDLWTTTGMALSVTAVVADSSVVDAAAVWQAEVAFPTLATADATYSASGYALMPSASGTAASLSTAAVTKPPVGRCRLWARVDGRSSTFSMSATYELVGNATVASVVAGTQWVSLGDFATPPTGGSTAADGTPADPTLRLTWTRLTGSDILRVDAFVWEPLDVDDLSVVATALFVPSFAGASAVMDGERLITFTKFGTQLLSSVPTLAGPYLSVMPGGANTLRVIGSSALTESTQITATYHPRYLSPTGA